MSCSCRAAPWRIFVQSLAQVHKLEAPTASTTLAFRPAITRTVVQQQGNLAVAKQGSRSLHTSRYRCQDAVNTVEPVQGNEKATKSTTDDGGAKTSQAPEVIKAGEQQAYPKKNKRAKKPKLPFTNVEKSNLSTKTTPIGKTNSRRGKGPPSMAPMVDDIQALGAESTSQARPQREKWQLQKQALKEKFPDGWQPRKRLSPDALAGIRALNAQFPDVYTTKALADKFEVSPEGIRRVLKSKWRASVDEEQERQDRWFRRGKQVWEQKAALGIKPPQRWRAEGVARDPAYHEWSRKAAQREREWDEEENRKYREHRARKRDQAAGKAP